LKLLLIKGKSGTTFPELQHIPYRDLYKSADPVSLRRERTELSSLKLPINTKIVNKVWLTWREFTNNYNTHSL